MWFDDVQVLLRVYLRNTDKYRWLSATDSLVERARRHGVAGATVVRGILGVDQAGDLLEARPWSVVQPAPVVVELVDEPGVVGSFLSVIAEVAPNALITAQEVVVRLYRRREKALATVTRQECGASGLGTPPWPDVEPTPAIPFGEPGQLLRVFMRGTDTHDGELLSRAAVLRARELQLAWAAVFRGVVGYGTAGCVRAARLFGALDELPLVVEILDRAKNVQELLPFFDAAVEEGIITLEDVAFAGD
jgi:PII-like signaling protein